MFGFGKASEDPTKKYETLESLLQSTELGIAIKTELGMLRSASENHKHKAYITVTKNPDTPQEEVLAQSIPNQLQDDSADDMHIALWENQGAAAQLGFTHMAASDNAAGLPADSATTLLAEITTNGLTRTDADTTTHTTGQKTTLVEHTYTATGTHTAVQKGALFDANSAGTMGIVYLFTSTNLVNTDTLQVSVTVTLND